LSLAITIVALASVAKFHSLEESNKPSLSNTLKAAVFGPDVP
jgi:hypothetical protein